MYVKKTYYLDIISVKDIKSYLATFSNFIVSCRVQKQYSNVRFKKVILEIELLLIIYLFGSTISEWLLFPYYCYFLTHIFEN